MFKPKLYIPSNGKNTKPDNNFITDIKNKAISLLDWFGIDLQNGDTDKFLNQRGQWTEPSGDGSKDAWLKTANPGTDPNADFIGTTDGARLNVIGGGSSNVDVGVLIYGNSQSEKGVLISGNSESEEGAAVEGTSQSGEGVLIDGASQSGEGVLIDGYSPPHLSSIHLKNNGGGIRLSGIAEGSDKILVSVDNNGNASWVSPNVSVFNFNEYISDAAADADVTLPSGGLYKLTGGRTIYQKP